MAPKGFGNGYPPGVKESMIPGCRSEDDEHTLTVTLTTGELDELKQGNTIPEGLAQSIREQLLEEELPLIRYHRCTSCEALFPIELIKMHQTKVPDRNSTGYALIKKPYCNSCYVKLHLTFSPLSPQMGGCWYCGLTGGLLFDCFEFDTNVHALCVARALKKNPNDKEAQVIAQELGVTIEP